MKGRDTVENYSTLKLRVTNGRRIECQARLLAEYSTNRDGEKDRWQELRLHVTPGGAWIAELVGRSTRRGDRDLVTAKVIYRAAGMTEDEEDEAMTVWGYSDAAYAMAKILGWDPVDRPD